MKRQKQRPPDGSSEYDLKGLLTVTLYFNYDYKKSPPFPLQPLLNISLFKSPLLFLVPIECLLA